MVIHTNDHVPEWPKHCIGYQIFVDSFAIGIVDVNKKKELYDHTAHNKDVYTLKWNDKDDKYHYGQGYYGGDLKGVIYAVTHYLKNLGIDFIYLTPIFKASSNHKYDTIDYYTIDPHFGTIEDFRELVRVCHENGMRLIIDGVFNHTSSEHPWYQKASKGDMEYVHRYQTNEDGFIINYEGVKTMPQLNHNNPAVKEYFYSGEDNVITHWLDEGIDGWRLDVAERLTAPVLADIRKAIKTKYPDRVLVGEVIETYGKEWLQDGLLDGVMNYVFKGVTTNFLTDKIDGTKYMDELKKMYDEYPREKLYVSWNLLSSHDTNRLLFDVDHNESFFKIAGAFQFTYPGMPMIYYGDELGMEDGQKDLGNRTGMDWDVAQVQYHHGGVHHIQAMAWDRAERFNKYHQFYKHLVYIRRKYPVFIDGNFIPAYADENVIAYYRQTDSGAAFIIANKGLDANVTIPVPEPLRRFDKLQCVYGGNGVLNLNRESFDFWVGCSNALIFAC